MFSSVLFNIYIIIIIVVVLRNQLHFVITVGALLNLSPVYFRS